jgi:hypothetical protein
MEPPDRVAMRLSGKYFREMWGNTSSSSFAGPRHAPRSNVWQAGGGWLQLQRVARMVAAATRWEGGAVWGGVGGWQVERAEAQCDNA